VIKVTAGNGIITFTVKDDGNGFDMQQVRKGNGLHNMQQRAMACGGNLSVKSAPGTGTTILLEMPVI